MTEEYTAWVTTSQSMPNAEPGITITMAEVDEDGYRDERGEVATSEPQPGTWGIRLPDWVNSLYEPEPDELLAVMGWERAGDWTRSSLSWAATVTKKETS